MARGELPAAEVRRYLYTGNARCYVRPISTGRTFLPGRFNGAMCEQAQ